MRICFINPAGAALFDQPYVSRQPYGGAEVALVEQARALARDGAFDVHMLVNHHRDGVFQRDGITVHTIGGTYADQPLIPFASYRRAFVRALVAVGADLYVQRGVPADLYFLAACTCAALRKPYVQVLALAPVTGIRPTSVRRFLRWIVLERASLRLATAVVALAHDQVAALAAPVRRKTHVIREGKPPGAVRAQRRDTVLWTGRAHRSKRPELFVALARALPEQPFLMAVAGSGPVAPGVSEPTLPPNLTIQRNVPHAAMDELYASARLLVHTSTQEGFANVFLEAWSSGKPVLTSVDPDDVVAAFRLGRVATDYATMKQHLARHIKKHLGLSKCS